MAFITLSYILFKNCYGKLKDKMGDTPKAIHFDLTTVYILFFDVSECTQLIIRLKIKSILFHEFIIKKITD